MADDVRTGLTVVGPGPEGHARPATAAEPLRSYGSASLADVLPPPRAAGGSHEKPPRSLDGSFYGRPVRAHVREFGAVFATFFLVIAAVKGFYGSPLPVVGLYSAAAAATVAVSRAAPRFLLTPWRWWMLLGELLGRVTTPVLLFLVWWTAVVPVAFAVRLLRIKVMDTSFDRAASSYWIARPRKKDDFRLLERQF